jgi:hypothetical protein
MIKHPCVGGRYGENHEGEPGEDRERRGDVLKALHCLLHLLAKTSSVTNSWTIAEAATGRELVYNRTIRAAYPPGSPPRSERLTPGPASWRGQFKVVEFLMLRILLQPSHLGKTYAVPLRGPLSRNGNCPACAR